MYSTLKFPHGQKANFYNCYIRSVHTVSNVSFVADVSEKQSAWERSGKFEGDIMMTDEQKRNFVIRPERRWPNGVVPFVIDDVFSEYCSTKATMWFARRGRNYPFIMSTALAAVHTGV